MGYFVGDASYENNFPATHMRSAKCPPVQTHYSQVSAATARKRLVSTLAAPPRSHLLELAMRKVDAVRLRQRQDVLWFLLVESAATLGRSAGWDAFMRVGIERQGGLYDMIRFESLIIRHTKRLDRFTLRGKEKVGTQWRLYCLVHNIEKIGRMGELARRG